MRRVLPLFFLASSVLMAADFSGRWAGTIEINGSRSPIYLNLIQSEGTTTGTVSTGADSKPAQIEKSEFVNGGVTFELHDNANRLLRFRLSMSGGVLSGEVTDGLHVSTVAVVSIGGGVGARLATAAVSGIAPSPGTTTTVGNIGSGAYRVGGGVSAPVLIRKVEPEYTEEARAAKYQGTVTLYVQVAPDGTAINIRVLHSLGLGLDEKAIEAVKQWKFRPGQKDGQPVTVEATIEVNFRL